MKKVDVKIVHTRKKNLELSFRSTFKREKLFRNEAIAKEKEKHSINLSKPIYIEAVVLGLSKVLLQDRIKDKYGAKAEMLLTYTDSLIYIIETENVYEDFYQHKALLDFSNHPKEPKYHDNLNNLVLGKIKDETCGVPIKSFL